MSITLSTVGSANITIDIEPSPFQEAPGGILISYRLHDGPITFTLTVQEARALIAEIIQQLTTPPPW
ncbi:MAG TPA: hypothetical protein VLV25_06685 [Steroidobacteraceae bacterium]|nr:hypothetical protein [Steroidobacteraceae bacterium]